MKRAMAMTLALVLLLSLAGCGGRGQATGSNPTNPGATGSTPTGTVETPPPTDHRDPAGGGLGDPNGLQLGKTGRIRVTYTINMSSIRYITSVEQLPHYEELKQFDEAYFREKALILVFETVNSGMVQVDIESVTLNGNTASVRLAHNTSSGVSTGDMATWLLWAEVDRGLIYQWVVENPAVKSEASEY